MRAPKTSTATPARRQRPAPAAAGAGAHSVAALTAHTVREHGRGPTLVSHGDAPAAGLLAALKKLPWHMAEALSGVRVVACVRATDVYPTDKLALAAAKIGAAVVVPRGDEVDVVVPTGTPGCVDAMWQACGHARDVRAGSPSNDPQFRAALTDARRAIAKNYGPCTPAQAFAFSFADYASDEAGLRTTMPALHRYWLQVSYGRMGFAGVPTQLREVEGSRFKLLGDAATDQEALEKVTAGLETMPQALVELVLARGYRFVVAGESPETRFPDARAQRHADYDTHLVGKYISLFGYHADVRGVREGLGLAIDAIFKVSSSPAYVALVGKPEEQHHRERFHERFASYLNDGRADPQSDVDRFFAAAERAGWDFAAQPAPKKLRSAAR